MSREIDWSKAPEGAMVLLKHVRDNRYAWAVSHTEESDAWMVERTGFGFRLMKDCWRVVSTRPTTPSWSGEGLPPVGVVCEIAESTGDLIISYPAGHKVKIYAHFTHVNGTEIAAFADDAAQVYGCGYYRIFRPIRTPDQIAADERESYIRRMQNGTESLGFDEYEICATLYDKGLRFQD